MTLNLPLLSNITISAFIHVFLVILFEIVLYYTYIANHIGSLSSLISPYYLPLLNLLSDSELSNGNSEESKYINSHRDESIRNSGIILGSILFTIILLIIYIQFYLKLNLSIFYISMHTIICISLIIGIAISLLFAYLLKLSVNTIDIQIRFLKAIKYIY